MPVQRQPLNARGWADYFWFDVKGARIQVEHKQWNEFLAEFPDHVEEQLRRQVVNADQHYLMIEGWPLDGPYGIDTYKETISKKSGRTYFRKSRSYGGKSHPRTGLLQGICSWSWKMDRLGITVIRCPSRRWMLTELTTLYTNTGRADFIGWDRYHKPITHPKARIKGISQLMATRGIGEVTALKLIDWYGNALAAYRSTPEEMAEVIGWNSTRRFFSELEAEGGY